MSTIYIFPISLMITYSETTNVYELLPIRLWFILLNTVNIHSSNKEKEILQFLGLKSTVYNWEWFQVKSGLKWCLYGILNAQFENQVWKGIYWTVVACVNDKIKIRELVLYYGPIDPWNAWKIFGKNTNYIHRFTLSKFFGLFGCISSIMHGRRPRRLSSAHRCVWTRSCPIKFGIQTEKTICYTVV